jgi:hypothetical protein
MAGSRFSRMVGKNTVSVTEIEVQRITHHRKCPDGKMRPSIVPPFMPRSASEPYHPGGNSLCYMVTTAHLMGCYPIYAMGFTLKSGGGYFFNKVNPVTRRASIYDTDRAMDWLRWYEATYPNRVRLLPGWEGPVYSVFATEAPDAIERTADLIRPEDRTSARERDAEPNGEVSAEGTGADGRVPAGDDARQG